MQKNESNLTALISGTTDINTIERYGKVVHLCFRLQGSVTGTRTAIAQVPEGYRPSKNIQLIGTGYVDSVFMSAILHLAR